MALHLLRTSASPGVLSLLSEAAVCDLIHEEVVAAVVYVTLTGYTICTCALRMLSYHVYGIYIYECCNVYGNY